MAGRGAYAGAGGAVAARGGQGGGEGCPGQLYMTGDPAWLAPYLRGGGGGDLCHVTLVSEENKSDPKLPDIAESLDVPNVTDVLNSINEVLGSPEKDCPEITGSHPYCLEVGEDKILTTLEVDKEQTSVLRMIEPSKPSSDDPSDKCDLCEYAPNKPSRKTIRVHKDAVHLGVKYPCGQCNFVSTTRSNLLKHVDMKHSGKKYQCKECSFITHSKQNHQHHTRSKHADQQIKCTVNNCTYSNGIEECVAEHKMREHDKKIFHCLVCFRKFSYLTFLMDHIKFSHSGLFCDTCFFQPQSNDDLKRHNIELHGGAFYPCRQCDTTCLSQLNLRWHMIDNRNFLNIEQKKGTKNPTSSKRTKKKISEQKHKLEICDICGYKPSKISPFAMRVHKVVS